MAASENNACNDDVVALADVDTTIVARGNRYVIGEMLGDVWLWRFTLAVSKLCRSDNPNRVLSAVSDRLEVKTSTVQRFDAMVRPCLRVVLHKQRQTYTYHGM